MNEWLSFYNSSSEYPKHVLNAFHNSVVPIEFYNQLILEDNPYLARTFHTIVEQYRSYHLIGESPSEYQVADGPLLSFSQTFFKRKFDYSPVYVKRYLNKLEDLYLIKTFYKTVKTPKGLRPNSLFIDINLLQLHIAFIVWQSYNNNQFDHEVFSNLISKTAELMRELNHD